MIIKFPSSPPSLDASMVFKVTGSNFIRSLYLVTLYPSLKLFGEKTGDLINVI